MSFKKKSKSIFLTPDPYHTPGYCGFCPQFKYEIGETFGRTTSRLLTDNKVANSGLPVLTDILTDLCDVDKENEKRMQILRTRQHSLGDQKLVDNMVPGYSGFIPRSENYFGSRYTEVCRNSVAEFEHSYQCHDAKMQDLKYKSDALPRNPKNYPPILSAHLKPLTAVRWDALPYISPHIKPALPSPYYMENTDPNKNFMSGYKGFVPRARNVFGKGYPELTNKALITFTDEMNKFKSLKNEPIIIKREPETTCTPQELREIYPVGSGMIPDYTGHIPGQKFRYGETFGVSTKQIFSNPAGVNCT